MDGGPFVKRDLAASAPGYDAEEREKGEDREDGVCVTLSAGRGGMMEWLPPCCTSLGSTQGSKWFDLTRPLRTTAQPST